MRRLIDEIDKVTERAPYAFADGVELGLQRRLALGIRSLRVLGEDISVGLNRSQRIGDRVVEVRAQRLQKFLTRRRRVLEGAARALEWCRDVRCYVLIRRVLAELSRFGKIAIVAGNRREGHRRQRQRDGESKESNER